MNNQDKLTDKVTRERWQIAQAWEENHWLREQKALARYGKNFAWRLLALMGKVEKYRGNDRNSWWKQVFDGYSFLPPDVNNALEIGCGPYTNIRLMLEACKPRHIFLSDPLIRTYVNFQMTFVREMYRKAACCLDDHPAEELPFADNYFDLTIMINVLDHVQDADACMKSLIRVTKPGGMIIFGQDLTNEADLSRQPDGLKIGHPITLNEAWFERYFRDDFDAVLRKVLSSEEGWAEKWHYGTLVYAGRKK